MLCLGYFRLNQILELIYRTYHLNCASDYFLHNNSTTIFAWIFLDFRASFVPPTCCFHTDWAAVQPTVVQMLKTENWDSLLPPSLYLLLLLHHFALLIHPQPLWGCQLYWGIEGPCHVCSRGWCSSDTVYFGQQANHSREKVNIVDKSLNIHQVLQQGPKVHLRQRSKGKGLLEVKLVGEAQKRVMATTNHFFHYQITSDYFPN